MSRAGLQADLQELKSKYSEPLTRHEALDLALEAADLHMKFLRIAKDGPERREVASRASSILDEAERLKSSDDTHSEIGDLIEWEPLQPTRATSASVTAPSASASTRVKYVDTLSSSARPSQPTSAKSSGSSQASGAEAGSVRGGLFTIGDEMRLFETNKPPRRGPVSTRQLSAKERALLKFGSQLHGSQFPPWEADPTDSEFQLASGEKLYIDRTDFKMSDDQLSLLDGWKRPADALPPPLWKKTLEGVKPTMVRKQPTDFVQDAATDCSVVASLAAGTARAQHGHTKLLSSYMFPYDSKNSNPRLSPNGKYIIRLNFNGCPRKVVIDDRIPVSKGDRVLHVVDRNNPSLLWPALIEKAYLKARGGYDFPGSNSGTDLWILTGWIPEQVFLQHEETDPEELWDRIITSFRQGDLIATLGTGKMTERAEEDSGLAGEHDYAVLQVKESDARKMLLIKNPWLNATTWKDLRLRQSTKDSTSSGKSDSSSDDGRQGLEPGTFWMELGDVLQHFENMYLNWNPTFFTHREDIHFLWDLDQGHSIMGSFVDNPQFLVSTSSGGNVWMLLQKHSTSRKIDSDDSSEEDGYISLYAFENRSHRVYLSKGATEQGMYVDSPQTLLRLEPQKRSKYVIVPSEESLQLRKQSFTLSVFAQGLFNLEYAPSRYQHQTKEPGSWTKATAGGNLGHETYSQNPQYSVEFPQATGVSLVLETPTSRVNVHVKLVHGKGERVFTMTPADIVCDSSQYRPGVAHAQIEEVYAGKYTIICSTFEAGQMADFTLRVESNTQHVVKPVPKEGAGRIKQQLADASFGAGNRVLAAPMYPKKLAKINFKLKYARSTVAPPISDLLDAYHSPTRLTVELGRGPDRQILIASGNGSFLDLSRDVRTDDIDIRPNMHRKKDLWLVLERMGGFEAADSAEERIAVEMFADADEPINFGVWREWSGSR